MAKAIQYAFAQRRVVSIASPRGIAVADQQTMHRNRSRKCESSRLRPTNSLPARTIGL